VFLRVWHKIDQWKGKGSFKAWLYKIATNQALYFLRSSKKKNMKSLNFAVTSQADSEDESFLLADILSDESFPDPETLYAHKTRQEHLQQHISSLSPEKREILQMIYQEDFSIKEASETLGIPEGTVKSRLFYAIKQLSEDMRRFLT
jgi:RNA polymerase sigma-70 factor (ECF subfamily)